MKILYKSDFYEIEFEINDWAARSRISLLTKSKGTVILTVVNIGEELPGLDFVPLTVDYEEKFYAGGKIFGSRFVRREGRPTISSILNARLIDRVIRPLFPQSYRYQTQIINTLLSYDPETEPVILALISSSFALAYLGVPLLEIPAGISLSFKDNKWEINSKEEIKTGSQSKLIIGGTRNKINMIEFEGIEIGEKVILEGVKLGFEELVKIANFIKEKTSQNQGAITLSQENYLQAEELLNQFLEKHNLDPKKALFSQEEGDKNWEAIFSLIKNEFNESEAPYILNVLNKRFKRIFQKSVLEEKIRPDGRKLDEIRRIFAEIDVLPRVHGSAIFKRGLTHILSTVTLAAPGEELILRELEMEGLKNFMHQYNFPPYSTGELGSSKGPSRREIGHGELAEKALRNLIPPQDNFPYTIRVVSEVLSSNGSTSMGSVCASSLALMAAGVPLKNHIAGISIGLAYEDDKNYELLTDIQGPEDFFGGMDFKVAGTHNGITAIQLDTKIEGLNFEQIDKALERAKEARKKILNYMESVISEPRKEISPFAPKIETLRVDPLKIGLIIGSGGKTINEIVSTTNVKIDIQPDGLIYITSDNSDNIELAKTWIKIISDSLDIGEIIKGKVVKILPFGAVLELAPQKTALLHISEIDNKKIENIEDELKIGDELYVRVKNINEEGKIYVSLKNDRRKN